MAELLAVERLAAGHGDAIVIEDVSFTLEEGATLAVLGRNGAGKTTLLATIMGLTRRHGGEIRLRGESLVAAAPFTRVARGLGWVPQERFIFPSLTVQEHLDAVARPGPWTAARAYGLFPALASRRGHPGSQLSGGEQQMLAIARALLLNPALLLLDEPMEGLAPIIVQGLSQVIARLVREAGMSIILVEQQARLALALTEQAIVLERGRVVHRCASQQLLDDAGKLAVLLAP